MGKGIALEFKKRFPDMFKDYAERCKAKQVKLGMPYLFKRLIVPWILNFPTKDSWRSVTRLQDIIGGLQYLKRHYSEWGITSLAVPPLGCGLGQLEWRVVGPTLYRHLSALDIPIELYAPFGTPHEELQSSFLSDAAGGYSNTQPWAYRISPAWIAIVEILRRLENEPFHWPVGRITFQKIAYFATQSGIPTGLRFQRGSYGPYAPNLKKFITALVNNGLICEEQLGRMFAVHLGPTFSDAEKAYRNDIRNWEQIIEKVSDLFMRVKTKQAELAATVHFAAKEIREHSGGMPSEMEVLDYVREWKQKRRPPLDEKELASAIRNLNILGWIEASVSEDLPVPEEDFLRV